MAGVALMLYTVREESARDLEGVLKSVAEIGYDGVELFDLHGHEAAEVREWLDRFGLVAVGRHAGMDALDTELPALAEELRTLGCDRIALSWIDPPASSDEARAAVARIADVAQRAGVHGLRFGFHNHWGELSALDDADSLLDKLRALPAEQLWLELDLGWVWEAGADPVAELEQSAGRCPLVHVKDFRARGTARTARSATARSDTSACFRPLSPRVPSGSSSNRTIRKLPRLPRSNGRFMRCSAS